MTPQPPWTVCRADHRGPRLHSLLSCQESQSLLITVGVCIMNSQGCSLNACIGLCVNRLHDGKFDARCHGGEAVILHQYYCVVGLSLGCVWQSVVGGEFSCKCRSETL